MVKPKHVFKSRVETKKAFTNHDIGLTNNVLFASKIKKLIDPEYVESPDEDSKSILKKALSLRIAGVNIFKSFPNYKLAKLTTELQKRKKSKGLNREEDMMLAELLRFDSERSAKLQLTPDELSNISPEDLNTMIMENYKAAKLNMTKLSTEGGVLGDHTMELPKPIPRDMLVGSTTEITIDQDIDLALNRDKLVFLDNGSHVEQSTAVNIQHRAELESMRIDFEQEKLLKRRELQNVIDRVSTDSEIQKLEMQKIKYKAIALQCCFLQIKVALEQQDEAPEDISGLDIVELNKIKSTITALNNSSQQIHQVRLTKDVEFDDDSLVYFDYLITAARFINSLYMLYEPLAKALGGYDEVMMIIKQSLYFISTAKQPDIVKLGLKLNSLVNTFISFLVNIKALVASKWMSKEKEVKEFAVIDARAKRRMEALEKEILDARTQIIQFDEVEDMPVADNAKTTHFAAGKLISQSDQFNEIKNLEKKVLDCENIIKLGTEGDKNEARLQLDAVVAKLKVLKSGLSTAAANVSLAQNSLSSDLALFRTTRGEIKGLGKEQDSDAKDMAEIQYALSKLSKADISYNQLEKRRSAIEERMAGRKASIAAKKADLVNYGKKIQSSKGTLSTGINQGDIGSRIELALERVKLDRDAINQQIMALNKAHMKSPEQQELLAKLQSDIEQYDTRYMQLITLNNVNPKSARARLANAQNMYDKIARLKGLLADRIGKLITIAVENETTDQIVNTQQSNLTQSIADNSQRLRLIEGGPLTGDMEVQEITKLKQDIDLAKQTFSELGSKLESSKSAGHSRFQILYEDYKVKKNEMISLLGVDDKAEYMRQMTELNKTLFEYADKIRAFLLRNNMPMLGLNNVKTQRNYEYIENLKNKIGDEILVDRDAQIKRLGLQEELNAAIAETANTNIDDVLSHYEGQAATPPLLSALITNYRRTQSIKRNVADAMDIMENDMKIVESQVLVYAEGIEKFSTELQRINMQVQSLSENAKIYSLARQILQIENENVNLSHLSLVRSLGDVTTQLQRVKNEHEGVVAKLTNRISKVEEHKYKLEKKLAEFDKEREHQERLLIQDLQKRGMYNNEPDPNSGLRPNEKAYALEKLASQALGNETEISMYNKTLENFRSTYNIEREKIVKEVNEYAKELHILKMDRLDFSEIEHRETLKLQQIVMDIIKEKMDHDQLVSAMEDDVNQLAKTSRDKKVYQVVSALQSEITRLNGGSAVGTNDISAKLTNIYMYVNDLFTTYSILTKTTQNIKSMGKALSTCLADGITSLNTLLSEYNSYDIVRTGIDNINRVTDNQADALTLCLSSHSQGYIKTELTNTNAFCLALQNAYEQDTHTSVVQAVTNKRNVIEGYVSDVLEQAYSSDYGITQILRHLNGVVHSSKTLVNSSNTRISKYEEIHEGDETNYNLGFMLLISANGRVDGVSKLLNTGPGMTIVYKKDDVIMPIFAYFKQYIDNIHTAQLELNNAIKQFFTQADSNLRHANNSFSTILGKVSKGLTASTTDNAKMVRGKIILACSIIGGICDRVRGFTKDTVFLNSLKSFMDAETQTREMLLRYADTYLESYKEALAMVYKDAVDKVDSSIFDKSSIFQNGFVQKSLDYVLNQINTIEDSILQNKQRAAQLTLDIKYKANDDPDDILSVGRPINSEAFVPTLSETILPDPFDTKHEEAVHKRIKRDKDVLLGIPKDRDDSQYMSIRFNASENISTNI